MLRFFKLPKFSKLWKFTLSINPNSLKLIAQITLFILKEINGNAILLFNEETMIIQRINGQLIFNQQEWQLLTGVDINNLMLNAIA